MMCPNKRYLLVEPDFPTLKNRNHYDYLPIGLLKIASYLREQRNEVKLVYGYPDNFNDTIRIMKFNPDEVWVTSMFTYWAKYVKETVQYYKSIFSKAKVIVGGIYASLMPDHCKKYTGCDEVYVGVHSEAEKYFPAYDLIKNDNGSLVDYQIIHASRGCIRQCPSVGHGE